MTNFQAIAIPVASVALGLLGGVCVSIYHFWDKRKSNAARHSIQNVNKANQMKARVGYQIVEAVDSNNDFPKFGENLTSSFARMEQLQITLNSDLKGCAMGGEQQRRI